MWEVTTLFFIFIAGYSAANEDCNINPAVRCIEKEFEVKFPENEEEAGNLCMAFKSKTGCFLNFSEACEGDQNEINQMKNVISYLSQNCDGNSSVYQGAINYLGCMKPIFSADFNECKKTDDVKAMKFINYLMDLSERGIKEASDNDSNMMKCLDVLYLDACLAAEVGQSCGSSARNSVVDIFQNLDINLKICKQEIIDDMNTLVNMFES